jgi:hypothetical protein
VDKPAVEVMIIDGAAMVHKLTPLFSYKDILFAIILYYMHHHTALAVSNIIPGISAVVSRNQPGSPGVRH